MRAVKKHRRHLAGAALLVGAAAALVYTGALEWDAVHEDVSCHYRSLPGEIPDTEDPEFAPPPGRSIFFHETSYKFEAGAVGLTARQACAVESAARANPEHYVYVLFSSSVVWNSTRVRACGSPLEALLLSYRNVRCALVRLERYAAGSPLQAWLATGALNASRYRTEHTSDVLRYLTLWKYGGVYLDLDVVVAKPLCSLAANWAGGESRTVIAAGAISFSRDADGKRYADAAIRELRASFRGDEWGYNGPGVITRVLVRHCHTSRLDMMSAERCGGFVVYPEEYFSPIAWRAWRQYFEAGALRRVRDMNSTYIFHVWNKHSAKMAVRKDAEVPYTYLARTYCPEVYRAAKDSSELTATGRLMPHSWNNPTQ